MKNNNSYLYKKLANNDHARIRVDAKGGAYIPSEEIASLPEVKAMQQRAASIVGQYRRSSDMARDIIRNPLPKVK